MAKYGSASLAVLLSDGVSLLPLKAAGLTTTHTAVQDTTTGLGDAWPEKTPTGAQMTTLALEEAFYDTAASASLHDHFSADGATSRVVCYALEGDTIGNQFYGHQGVYSADYEVLAKQGHLTKVKIGFSCTGAREEGVILQSTATKTADWDTEGADSVDDNGASSSNGGSGYLQVTAMSGFTGFVLTFQDSTDDVTYASLVACSNVTSAPTAQRVTVTGTVDRYLSVDGNVTGSGSITVWAGFSRAA